MASDEARKFVDWTMYAVATLAKVEKIIIKAQKKGALTKAQSTSISTLLDNLNNSIGINFPDHPSYRKTLQKRINERIFTPISDETPNLSQIEANIENLIANIYNWMINEVVKIETQRQNI